MDERRDICNSGAVDAVAAIKKLGGSVRFDAKSGEVTEVFYYGPKITDAGLEDLTKALPSCKIDLHRPRWF